MNQMITTKNDRCNYQAPKEMAGRDVKVGKEVGQAVPVLAFFMRPDHLYNDPTEYDNGHGRKELFHQIPNGS